ncbi:TonB-dependent receptor [Methylobacterium sp. 1030]|uniref:TonB-dependent receptor family protein n=1 Tax=Methylobacterium sp. 1030 TaxID=3156404 RepID=UPI0033983126
MYRIPRVKLYAALLLTLLATTSVFAQTAATQSVTLSELSVSGSAGPLAETQLPPAAQAASLTVPTIEQARAELQRTPGGVALVPDTYFKNRPAQTLKDVLDFVPGVIVQPRFGSDARLSIRGSGLSRNYGNRGINVFQDGIPINTSDGLVDFFEIDPTAYRYVEVFRGANALRFGANALGGAINLVTPTGRDVSPFEARIDAGSFGYLKGQAATGGVSGPFDYFLTLSGDRFDGFREHSDGNSVRGNANFGYQFSPDAETRFYVNANTINQRIPGEVTRQSALTNPRAANPVWVLQDQQRNIDSVRLANKTTLRFDETTLDFGVFTVQRHVDHPIYEYLDYTVQDYGGFVRATDDRVIGGFRNRLVVGVNVDNGTIDYRQFVNLNGAVKGPLTFSTLDRSENLSAYAENSFFILPNVALVGGGFFLRAVRDRKDRLLTDGDQSGRSTYDIAKPKFGVLWDVDPTWQVYGNVSGSAEAPTFDANSFATFATSNLRAQTATTYEVGTRGVRPDLSWDLSLYRSEIQNELQCLTTSIFSPCSIVNADRTVHQGVEAGLEVAFLKSLVTVEDRVWFNAAYTYNDFFFVRDALYGNNRLPGVPTHYLRAEVLYRHPSGFYAGPNVEWSPQSYFADNANSLTVPAYALLNLRIGFDQGSAWSGYLEARNLLDKRYISSVAIAGIANASSEIFNPGTGRAIYGGLRYRW